MAEIESRLKQENSDLKHEISVFKTADEVLKSRLERSEVENRHLKSKVDSIEKEIDILKSAASLTSFDHPENDTKVDKDFRRVAPYHPPAPQSAFKARLTHKLTNVGSEQIIPFDLAEINIGNQYNPTTGVFTCDIPGLYVFHLTLTIYSDKYVELRLYKNGQSMHYVYVGNKGYLGSESTTALIQLDQGDTVLIKSDQYHSTGDLIYPGYSYFSGFLLYPRIQN
ncbi:complement C1q tumor necrosis factor-related protein 5-like [Mizuhopecten yessoensis]|uniref:Collagen alpha-1(X) chain n=1 Tax=Mizuhopecten yessoensis TaxID=6573 RepID=A0A210PUZ5_MIZYE|nr:complement C1q tumor necrosis factor-related protein 5-like [Mizuhopecten yessoensis]OWF40284.1 Collagen alpha-1(X) chain [Mizuhopecten yessoensis]